MVELHLYGMRFERRCARVACALASLAFAVAGACSSEPSKKSSHADSGAHEPASRSMDAGAHEVDVTAFQPDASWDGMASKSAKSKAERDAGTAPGMRGDATAAAVGGGRSAARSDVDGGPDTLQPEHATSVQELADGLASAVCAALEQCLRPQKLNAVLGGERCQPRFRDTFEQDDLAWLEASLRAGRVRLDATQLADCYRDTRALGCAVQVERLPASCQRAVAGQVAVGDACNISSDCAGDAFCPQAMCPRVCTVRVAAGATCERDDECQSGFACLGGMCKAPLAEGGVCGADSGGVCALGTSCLGSTDAVTGVCTANATIQSGGLGEACKPGGTLCREGLSCAFAGGDMFTCQAPVGVGEACRPALPGQCPAEQYCNARDLSSVGHCVALPVEAQPCVLHGVCAPRHVCVSEDQHAICRRIGDLGEPCTIDEGCRSGHCSEGTCSVRGACLAP